MLIRNAEIYRGATADVRTDGHLIAGIGRLTPDADEHTIDARGGALLPGLHDHHLHLMSYAASLASVPCGPPEVADEAQLIAVLNSHTPGPDGSLRGVGYHESVAPDLDRHWLDAHAPDVPLRIQHRSGRLWILNSRCLEELAETAHTQLSKEAWREFTERGRLYDQDLFMRTLPRASPPDVSSASKELASFGVTAFTDMTPHNSHETLTAFEEFLAGGTLLQRVQVAGQLGLKHTGTPQLKLGATKVHLHESDFPPFESLCRTIESSHLDGRKVAIHCVTEAELVFALAALREASPLPGDRIEHASVAPPALLEQMAELGVTVVTQPNFVTERGDAYLSEVPTCEHSSLYRCRSFLSAGIPLAAGTDAPFGSPDPWAAMHAAVTRRTRSGTELGAAERLTPEQALDLFTGSLETPQVARRIQAGCHADLCLLDQSWNEARTRLSRAAVRATIRDGMLIYDRVDQPPL